ncbi:MAG: response regulator [bacterium]|nr:response regulator [bacterium]
MKKILFIEDEPALQEALGEALKQSSYAVVKATDGDSGLRLAKSELPDLILLDLIMPNKDGYEVLEDLKNDLATNRIPVIVLTNLEGMKDIEKAIAAGATNYLVKTRYELGELIEKIKKILGE